jgi:hemoglobin-like flavoprotein
MTNKQITLIRSSWEKAGEQPLTTGILFYDRLFALAPETRYVFRTPVSDQTAKLMAVTGSIINKLEQRDEIIYDITGMAQEYAGYGLKAMHYRAVGNSLLWALEKRLDNSWSNELKEAWSVFYKFISEQVRKMAELN